MINFLHKYICLDYISAQNIYNHLSLRKILLRVQSGKESGRFLTASCEMCVSPAAGERFIMRYH